MANDHKILLSESELPHAWYNIMADMPTEVPPPLHPATHQPVGPQDLAPLFPMALIQQEVSTERYIEIPGAVRDILRLWRPSPLHRALNLEKALGTPARIYYKNEGVSPAGSHKPNTAVAQVYYNKMEGVRSITTETGAGQWGSALAMACQMFDIECRVWMVKVSYYQKPYRRSLIQLWGASVLPSPSEVTEAGRAALARDPNTSGSLGLAISEAVEVAAADEAVKYSLGSVLNHVLLHQTVIGEEALKQMQIAGDYPDVVIGCVGGGSNFAGMAFPFVRERMERNLDTEFLAVEPTACPTLTRGKYAYDFGDVSGMTPLIKMHTLGHDFVPSGIHAGGLRYHGMAALISALVDAKVITGRAVAQTDVFKAALTFARTEGIVPAPESAHAIRTAIDEALKAKETGEEKCILFNLSGHGHFDMAAYDAYLAGELMDFEYPQESMDKSLANLPAVE
ncbi:MAG: TrpB-like pyridoxal phosphate-dependent enzyme [Anaerolineae bacterium]|nr:TrpB-like pyridoxal phosphate-dependent enzyme [Anaerolineae bacterium]